MMYASDGKTYDVRLNEMVGKGGEGKIYKVGGHPDKVAKIFDTSDRSRDEKLEALSSINWSPEFRKYIVVPETILYEDSARRRPKGYIMEYVQGYEKLSEIYSDAHPLSAYKRAWIALNIWYMVDTVHKECGCSGNTFVIIGDFNSKNILVNRTDGSIKLIDTDSLHLQLRKNGTPVLMPCTALDPLLFCPELLALFRDSSITFKTLPRNIPTFTCETDYYCAAFHTHLCLIGQRPFGAALTPTDLKNSVVAPSQNELSFSGSYVYSNLSSRYVRPQIYPEFDVISKELQDLFIRAFQYGAFDPKKRPQPAEFIKALEEYLKSLQFVTCDGFDHYLPKGYSKGCEWCRIEQMKRPRTLSDEDIRTMNRYELKNLAEHHEEYRQQAEKQLKRLGQSVTPDRSVKKRGDNKNTTTMVDLLSTFFKKQQV